MEIRKPPTLLKRQSNQLPPQKESSQVQQEEPDKINRNLPMAMNIQRIPLPVRSLHVAYVRLCVAEQELEKIDTYLAEQAELPVEDKATVKTIRQSIIKLREKLSDKLGI